MSTNQPIKFPQAPGPFDMVISIKTKQTLGPAINVFLQEQARQLPLYDYPIEYNEVGHDKDGKEIKINTVGRWLFGVPGSSKHFMSNFTDNEILIHISSGYPYIVFELLDQLKEKIEKNN